ncbi:hypothetical protein P175DRAFT_0515046 [Aspergillus ochraceoroseus IBT 24754]|uniref:Vesicle tethering protein Uso1/P115-like head domain-containing protein n=1 Tax=Aspergillus ochraceoroseus IBT 24754 TaxID=1392256 RepID=A0A2T5M3I4_9EURO|nr:uncharacterized protein P175DRAFT_0515046 [Aspergillus ochraceoroseus IBT 24754]PTU23079.1 hypothetical protein P175DRAFT_0515046 [Aspergillus ochraceoroseus IBT 24754]
MFRILESQAPAKQTATDTINTLSSRLQSATLLEDRRAAIQGLRSFAKIYPASVASGALRPLISSLRNDREDVDTLKVVLETLLMLFSPDESSPEASDEIALWLSDEFTQRQDNITALLDLLDTRDFYSRLYSLQLMFQISSARPERTQECILTAPLGIPRLVGALGDAREPIRNESLLLLIALTPASEEFQKLVAFENAFESIFSLMETEGGLAHGSEVIEDCLSLLANLLRLNIPNQSYFREMGCIQKLAKLLTDVNKEEESEEPTPQWALAHRDKNIWGLLVIIQLFLVKGGINTPTNQMAFWNSGVMEQVLSTAFGQRFNVNVTAKALATCADLIRANTPLQERFGDVEVSWGPGEASNGVNGTKTKALPRINVIEALLKLSLEPASIQLLDARLAACECVKAFFANHNGIRVHVLGRAINGHVSGQDEIPNILSVLLTPPESRGNADPYQTWMASVLMFHLSVAMGVTEGDADIGNLITGINRGDDERISLGYLMLLCGWLFEEPDASLLQETKHRGASNVLVPGLSTILLGIIYEFSSKDSPIPRKTLHKLEQYIDRITRFRESPMIRDFEVLPQTVGASYDGGLPDIFFDRMFVEFLKDNFTRLIRAIDREPGLEISVITNGVERGVSRELGKGHEIQKLEHKIEHEQAEHRKTKDSRNLESSKMQQMHESLQRPLKEQHNKLKNDLLKQHGEQLRAIDTQKSSKFKERHEAEIRSLELDLIKTKEQHTDEAAGLTRMIDSLKLDATKAKEQYAGEATGLARIIDSLKSDATRTKEQHVAEVSDLNRTIQGLQSTINTAKQEHVSEVTKLESANQTLRSEFDTLKEQSTQDIEAVRDDYSSRCSALESRAEQAEKEVARLEAEVRKSAQAFEDAQKALVKAKEDAKEKEEGRKAAQAELEDLLIVFGDLETKRNEDKKRLKDLGQEVSEDEEGDEEDEEEEEEE